MCQIFGHGLKLLYFGAMVDQVGTVDPLVAGLAVASAVPGTMLSKRVLEAMTDGTYRRWAGYITTVISALYGLHSGRLRGPRGTMAQSEEAAPLPRLHPSRGRP